MGNVKVTYDDPVSAPISGGSAVSLALLVFGAIRKAIDNPGPSLKCIPDQRVVEMLTARRNKWEYLALLHPRISYRHVPSSNHLHIDPLANTEEEGM